MPGLLQLAGAGAIPVLPPQFRPAQSNQVATGLLATDPVGRFPQHRPISAWFLPKNSRSCQATICASSKWKSQMKFLKR
jgi:hypothetical protein